jgi:hypothetical protein
VVYSLECTTLAVSANKHLLVNAAYTLKVSDIEGVLCTEIDWVGGFDLATGHVSLQCVLAVCREIYGVADNGLFCAVGYTALETFWSSSARLSKPALYLMIGLLVQRGRYL